MLKAPAKDVIPWLQLLKERTGLTYSKLARDANLAPSTVLRAFKEPEKTITIETLMRLSSVHKVELPAHLRSTPTLIDITHGIQRALLYMMQSCDPKMQLPAARRAEILIELEKIFLDLFHGREIYPSGAVSHPMSRPGAEVRVLPDTRTTRSRQRPPSRRRRNGQGPDDKS
jgi:transcriptional regulator with XRE-family HTH domain